jgi:hypothetical protein
MAAEHAYHLCFSSSEQINHSGTPSPSCPGEEMRMELALGVVILVWPLLVVLVVLASLGWLVLAVLAGLLWVGEGLLRAAGWLRRT